MTTGRFGTHEQRQGATMHRSISAAAPVDWELPTSVTPYIELHSSCWRPWSVGRHGRTFGVPLP